ncbi:8238_t:CDS:1, partial [Racocetra fulgida]
MSYFCEYSQLSEEIQELQKEIAELFNKEEEIIATNDFTEINNYYQNLEHKQEIYTNLLAELEDWINLDTYEGQKIFEEKYNLKRAINSILNKR